MSIRSGQINPAETKGSTIGDRDRKAGDEIDRPNDDISGDDVAQVDEPGVDIAGRDSLALDK